MTPEQHIDRLKILKSPELINSVRVPAANVLLGTTKNRIIRTGEATDGSQIGQYSRKPAYFPKSAFVKQGAFKSQGKVRKGTKTMYLPEGYHQFRAIQGREVGFVNVDLSGSMMLDYQLGRVGNDIVMGFTNRKESEKRKGNEARFGKSIFKSSRPELVAYNNECLIGINKLTISVLRG